MELRISRSENGKYLAVDVLEAITGELERKMLKVITEEIKSHNIENVFVNVSRVRNIASVHEIYFFAYGEAELSGLPSGTRIAIFASPDDHSHDFVETVLNNAGYACHIFQDKGSAIQWLNK